MSLILVKKEFFDVIVKGHEVPITLLQLAALLNRLEPSHPQYQLISDELSIYQSGYRGESSLDYYLNPVDAKEQFILHSLRIAEHSTFQVDSLVLSPNFFLIIEVKNFTGLVTFDHGFGQMKRSINGEERVFKDPIAQVDSQVFHFQKWLMDHGYSGIPIETLVVFVSNYVNLTRTDGIEVDERIIHAGKFIERFQSLKQKYPHTLLSHQQLANLAYQIKNKNKPLHMDILKKYNLSARDIQPGVICQECRHLPMIRVYGRWQCPHCQNISRDAHINALKDFQLLFKKTIANREARWMLQVGDVQVISKLLKKEGFKFSGYKKDRTYYLNFNFQKDFGYLLKKENNSR